MLAWKGNSRASEEEEDFTDLNPTITFKHIHSRNLGVKDPLRVVALCDSDAFYAACEMVRLGLSRDTPLVVLQWESFIAVSYPARKYGISRFGKEVLKVKDAKERCPGLVVVHVATYKEGDTEPGYWENPSPKTHKVSLDYYRRESKKVHLMFKDMLPTGVVEKASIDEAFLDLTRPVRDILLDRYPELSELPEDMNTPLPPPPPIEWNELGYLIPINHKPDINLNDETQEAECTEYEEPTRTWHDVALSIGAELMNSIRKEVDIKLGYTTSAGIARNKFLAKLAASSKKPNGQSILRNAAIPAFLRPMPFQKIRFLGGKLGKAIAEEFEVSTVGDLLSANLEDMQRHFGDNSTWIYEIIRGVDRSEVKEKSSAVNKSMLAAKNLPQPITKPSEGHHWIRVLAAELALRLNDTRAEDPTVWPRTISLNIRKGYENGRSKQAPFPFQRQVTVDSIAGAGNKLWTELIGAADAPLKVTSISLSFSNIKSADPGQLGIEEFFAVRPSGKREREAESHSDHGDDRVLDDPAYTCPRCKKTLRLPTACSSGVDEKQMWDKMKMEHDDFHFAQDLAKQSPSAENQTMKKVTEPDKKRKRLKKEGVDPKNKNGGIAQFFLKR